MARGGARHRRGWFQGHLLVIVSPAIADKFSEALKAITYGASPDAFTVSIEKVLSCFDAMKPLYVAHYKQKQPSLPDAALAKLLAGTKNPNFVIKEVTNSISAGIYISHGHSSIYAPTSRTGRNTRNARTNSPI